MKYKSLQHSIDKPYYDKAYQLLTTYKGKKKMRLRAATVELVWGTLLHFRRLKKVYTIGNDLANKQVLMAAATYNLKKLMGFNSMKTAVKSIKNIVLNAKMTILSQILLFFDCVLRSENYKTVKYDVYYL